MKENIDFFKIKKRNKKIEKRRGPRRKYPQLSLDPTQVIGHYDLFITISRGVTITVTVDREEIETLQKLITTFLSLEDKYLERGEPS